MQSAQNEDVDADLFALKLKSRDVILMCSDGLSNMVDEFFEMEYIIRAEESISEKAQGLVDAANRQWRKGQHLGDSGRTSDK